MCRAGTELDSGLQLLSSRGEKICFQSGLDSFYLSVLINEDSFCFNFLVNFGRWLTFSCIILHLLYVEYFHEYFNGTM
jgi:hypothetical protein